MSTLCHFSWIDYSFVNNKFFQYFNSRMNEVMRKTFKEWSSENVPNEWKTIARFSRTFCTLNICSYLGAVFFYYLDALLAYVNQPVENRKLILDAKYPFDHRTTPIYEIIIVVQTIQAFALAISDSLTQILLVALVMNLHYTDIYASFNLTLYFRFCM